MTYELSINKKSHSRDLRSLDYYAGLLVTGSSDKTLKLHSVKAETIQQITTVNVFEKNILSVKINRRQAGEVRILVGCGDGKIYGLDYSGNPLLLIEHNSPVCSLDFIDSEHIVSGSWDGKGIVWNLTSRKPIAEYVNHKHAVAVFYNELTDQIVSGSQDKALAAWSWRDGKQRRRVEAAHNEIIREISEINGVGFITCSNDQSIKVWTSELEEIQSFPGAHSAFIFTVKSTGIGHYFSAGDDKSIKVWSNGSVSQTLQCPASIWSLAIEDSGEIYAGCSDGYLRVFSIDPNRKAELKVVQAFNKQILDSASKKSGMSAEEIAKLQTLADMAKMRGKKQGQIRVFRNGMVPEAFMWQSDKWEKIGEVITENNQGGEGAISQSKYYPGDKYFDAGQYEYIFDVDDESGMRKQIPFNDGANALEAAEKYCMREGLSKGYIEQIRKFLMQNSSKIPRKAIRQSHKQVPQSVLKSTPTCIGIEFTDIKDPQALIKKINEFNEQITTNAKLNVRELEHCARIATLLQNSKAYHSWKLDFKQMDTLKKLLQWPHQLKLPAWDMLRAFLCHYQSEALFSGLDAGFQIISQLCNSLERENKQPFYALIFRTLTNIMIQNTNKNGVARHADFIFNAVQNFSKRTELCNKNLLTAIAGFMFNFSVTVFEKNIENLDIISTYARILAIRLKIDEDEDNRGTMLQGAANVIFKYQARKNQFGFVKAFLGNNSASEDLNLLLS